jgi:hypothetical protein
VKLGTCKKQVTKLFSYKKKLQKEGYQAKKAKNKQLVLLKLQNISFIRREDDYYDERNDQAGFGNGYGRRQEQNY